MSRCTEKWLFDNDKKGNDAAPDYSGPVGEDKRIAGWRRMKDGKPYMSFQVSDKQAGGQQQKQQQTSSVPDISFDDEIPPF